MIRDYLENLIDCIFKILPLKEEENLGLVDYIDSIIIQIIGSKNVYVELYSNQKYLSILNVLYYLKNNEFTLKQCKREVFKCTNILTRILSTYDE